MKYPIDPDVRADYIKNHLTIERERTIQDFIDESPATYSFEYATHGLYNADHTLSRGCLFIEPQSVEGLGELLLDE